MGSFSSRWTAPYLLVATYTNMLRQNRDEMVGLMALRKAVGDDATKRILNSLVVESESLLPSLRTAIDGKDAKDIAFLAHKLKGLFASVSSRDLENIAKQLQLAGLREDYECAEYLYPTLCESFVNLKNFITGYLGGDSQPPPA